MYYIVGEFVAAIFTILSHARKDENLRTVLLKRSSKYCEKIYVQSFFQSNIDFRLSTSSIPLGSADVIKWSSLITSHNRKSSVSLRKREKERERDFITREIQSVHENAWQMFSHNETHSTARIRLS